MIPQARFRAARALGKLVTRIVAALTLERMPPFVSASAVVFRGDSVLMVVDSIRHEAVLPGGHLHWRETPRSGLVREVREETGYDIEPLGLVGVFAGEEWEDDPGIVRVVYEAKLTGGTLKSSAEGEATWLPARQIADSSTRDAPILKDWLNRSGADQDRA